MARHEAGPVSQWPFKGLFSQAKAKGEYQAWVHSDQMVLMIVRREAVPLPGGRRQSNESWKKNSRQPRNLTKNRQSDSLKIRVCLLFLVGRWRREILKLMVLMSQNQSDCHRSVWHRFRVLKNYGTKPHLSRPTVAAKWGARGRFSPYTSHMMGGRDKDGQTGHIIGPSWILHSPARHSWIGQGLQLFLKLNTIAI